MPNKTANPFGLEFSPSNAGKEADAYEVASTVVVLHRKSVEGGYSICRHATALHVISGKLHRLAERQCYEDLTCPRCQGDGLNRSGRDVEAATSARSDCRACAGSGLTTGRREAAYQAAAREIATHYGLSCYFQGDPRGCSLYIGENLTDSNYNCSHAVTRLGR